MELGNKESKYAVQINTMSYATKHVGVIYCNSFKEYGKILEENLDRIEEEGNFSTNISNDFEIGDVMADESLEEDDMKYYINK